MLSLVGMKLDLTCNWAQLFLGMRNSFWVNNRRGVKTERSIISPISHTDDIYKANAELEQSLHRCQGVHDGE